jgi:hypothetical protein
LGLKHSTIDPNVPAVKDTITREQVLRLRDLLQRYGLRLPRFAGACLLLANRHLPRRGTHSLWYHHGYGDGVALRRRKASESANRHQFVREVQNTTGSSRSRGAFSDRSFPALAS